jgi:hypothetical protein
LFRGCKIESGINKTIITGTQDFGKSLFLIYPLLNLVKERKRVFVVYEEENIYFDRLGGVFPIENHQERPIIPFGTERQNIR